MPDNSRAHGLSIASPTPYSPYKSWIFVSCIFISCNFMSCNLICHFHVLHFHPSGFDGPSFHVLCFTARAYAKDARAVFGVVILSVRLSVCVSHAWIVANLNGALQIFWYHTKGWSLCYSDANSGWWAMPPSLWNLRSKWPTPSKNADFDRFPLITSQPLEIAKKVQSWRI